MGLWTTYHLPNVYRGLVLRDYDDRDMALVNQFVQVTRWEFMEIYLHVPYKPSWTGAQSGRQGSLHVILAMRYVYMLCPGFESRSSVPVVTSFAIRR